METYEKLGSFYLGRVHDLQKNKTLPGTLLYDSKDLTTHAVCVGMTGSGKTGLCVGLIEEAAMDGIPSLIIDPKGDMTNLMLTFPDLNAESFKPWINTDEAVKKGMSPQQFAENQADFWRNGLAKWDQSGERIAALRHKTEMSIYTPGSTAGIPLSILKSFAAPPKELVKETESFGELISTTVTSLLGLVGIKADPIQSREHILLSSILSHYWKQGTDLDLSRLIQAVQSPPFETVGVFDLQSFYPPKERFELAMQLNNLLAAPGFQSWLQGEALDIDELLYTPDGKAKTSIFYIAHLSDVERMFFVSLFLNQVLSWVRKQPGTTSLRALLYFDELYGYLPPVENPPSKKPLLTLLKQARAFGLGVVLATQNPVDLDYKGLSNTGTWFIGRLQTKRDRDRVLDGLLTAGGGEKENLTRSILSKMISGLDKRVFLLHNVHEEKPEIFHTRWAMSYLRGPLTRIQIKELMATVEPQQPAASAEKSPLSPAAVRPMIDPEITQLFLPVRTPKPLQANLFYLPCLWASADIQFRDKTAGINRTKHVQRLTPIRSGALAVDWNEATVTDLGEENLLPAAEYEAIYEPVPDAAQEKSNYRKWQTDFKAYLYAGEKLDLFKSELFGTLSNADESERDFRIRLQQIAREKRDEEAEKLRQKYAKKIDTMEAKIRRAEDRVERESDQAKQHKLQTVVSIGTTLLGAFLGRKTLSKSTVSRAGTTIRRAGQTMKEQSDVERAEDELLVLQQQLEELEAEFKQELDKNIDLYDPLQEELKTVSIRPAKSHIDVKLLSFVWVPHWSIPGGVRQIA
ncbi:DUF87 domain-containing protein [candidate division KSB1 bacterium]|nr:DUF87 domain-containing protein [candidate division KSB1 bacterium]